MTEANPALEVTQASRILYGLNLVDAFGHVSCRDADRVDRFWMSRSMAPGLVTEADVIEHDLDGNPVSKPGAHVFLERFIHAEIYRARADVKSVVHSHAPSVVPFTVVDSQLRPVAHTCGFLHGTAPAFDVADVCGDGTDLLIRDARLGRSFVEHLGNQAVALMRSHGFTAVGATVPEAVFRAFYTAVGCQMQQAASQIGNPRFLSESESRACEATNRSQVGRSWDLWVARYASL